MRPALIFTALLALTSPVAAADFQLAFGWANTPPCASGLPTLTANPLFKLTNVPPGTHALEFEMIDLNRPKFRHGGGVIRFKGQTTIAPGAFTYLGPCPPHGERHRYMWTVYAKDNAGVFGRRLGQASAADSFPN